MNREYSTILFDADDTLLDFRQAERTALSTVLSEAQLPVTEAVLEGYHNINAALWRSFERGEITKEDIKNERYRRLFDVFHLRTTLTPRQINDRYLELLGNCGCTIAGAQTLCRSLKENGFDLYVITNGVAHTQISRLTKSGLLPYFSDVFVSETVGAQKPLLQFFDAVLRAVPEPDPRRIIVVGDTLGSDIQGAANAGLPCVWFNPHGAQNDRGLPVTVEAVSLADIAAVFKVPFCGTAED